MNITLWLGQGLLAAVFLFSGLSKGTQSKERMLATGQTGVREFPLGFIRFIALAELVGAFGLVVPWATQILPVLTPLAAVGLGIIMIGAARAHLRLHEPRNVALNLALLAVAIFVGLGRMS
jgi:uncharacterized membrane protein YphA (DoxX/SURF4 family)